MDVKHTITGAVLSLGGIVISVVNQLVANPACVPSEYQPIVTLVGAGLAAFGVGMAAKGPSITAKLVR